MNSKVLIASIAAIVLYFLGSWAIWGALMMDFYDAHMIDYEGIDRETPLIWAYLIASAGYGLLLVYVLQRGNTNSLGRGFLVGFIVGGLIAVAFDFAMYAGNNVFDGMAVLFVDILVSAALSGVIGAVCGWILGRGSQVQSQTV